MAHTRILLKASALLGAFAALFCLASTGAFAYPHLTAESVAPIYMKCDALTRGAKSARGNDWIEIESFSFGSSNASTIGSATGGAGGGKVAFHQFTIKKLTDSASPIFFNASKSGGSDNCTVNLDKANTSEQQPYLTIEFHDVMVSSYHVSSGGDRPTESVSLNFTKIEYKNKIQTGTGRGTTSGGSVLAPGGVKPSPSPSPSPTPRTKPQ